MRIAANFATTSMASLKEKIKLALDESRMLILGAQVFLGFDLRVAFEPAFERLPETSHWLKLVSIVVLLVTIGLLMSPGSYHRIVRDGRDAEDVHSFATGVMDLALVPFAIAISLDLYVTAGSFLGSGGASWQAAWIGAAALFCWYGLGWLLRQRRARNNQRDMNVQPTKLKDRIDQALTEARVVLPGVQAFLGFQLMTMLMDAFAKLPNALKYLHLVSLLLTAVTMILLMTPAAFHRIAENGEDSERVHEIASGFLLAAMVLLPLGICGDVFVVFRKISGSNAFATATSSVMLIFFYGLWFGFTAYRRMQLNR